MAYFSPNKPNKVLYRHEWKSKKYLLPFKGLDFIGLQITVCTNCDFLVVLWAWWMGKDFCLCFPNWQISQTISSWLIKDMSVIIFLLCIWCKDLKLEWPSLLCHKIMLSTILMRFLISILLPLYRKTPIMHLDIEHWIPRLITDITFLVMKMQSKIIYYTN